MSLAIVSAIIVSATTVLCCPFIRQHCEAIEDVQSEKINLKTDINTENCVANTNSSAKIDDVQQNLPIKPPRVLTLSCEKVESMCKENSSEFRVNCNPTSYDNGRLSKLVDQVCAITTAIISYLESCEEAGLASSLQAVTTFLKSHSSSLPISNELQKQTPVSGIITDSSKSVSHIPELEVPIISVTGPKTLKNLQNNYSLANHAVILDNEIDHIQVPTRTKFKQDMKSKEKDRNYMQSTLKNDIDSKSKKKNTLFKQLRKCVQPLTIKFRQYFCCKRRKQDKC